MLGLDLPDGRPEPDACVVDEHVQPLVALAVRSDDVLDRLLLGDVRRDPVHVEALGEELRDGRLELVGPPCGHRHAVAFLAEHPRCSQPDPARCSCDNRRALCHSASWS